MRVKWIHKKIWESQPIMKCFDPTINRSVTLILKNYLLGDKFYLKNISDWDENIRDWLAEKENTELTSEHLIVIELTCHARWKEKIYPDQKVFWHRLEPNSHRVKNASLWSPVVIKWLDMNRCVASFLNEIGRWFGCRPDNRSPPVTVLKAAAGIVLESGCSPTTFNLTPAKEAR